jgi:hypothetical protein
VNAFGGGIPDPLSVTVLRYFIRVEIMGRRSLYKKGPLSNAQKQKRYRNKKRQAENAIPYQAGTAFEKRREQRRGLARLAAIATKLANEPPPNSSRPLQALTPYALEQLWLMVHIEQELRAGRDPFCDGLDLDGREPVSAGDGAD